VAKAHHVRAQDLALLGRVGEVENVLDLALAAARRAGDTRRVNAVLSAAPRAALWGPSPVMRASGRCLDVVRILRMGQGNRHVEALALRCQAVLEAMRGRTDAARQILDRCRATLEELGLGMELVETEQYAGIVELIGDDQGAAERRLRTAYDGFAARGLGVGAAAAAARLARALLAQGRDTEAGEMTGFAEAHAGEQLRPTIVWCGVRAQILSRRGEHTEAEHYARRAVELASATDLVDHADARMALAHVLRAAGREEEAADQARQASRLYQAKGHEVGAARATAFAGERTPPPAGSEVAVLAGLPGGPMARLWDRLVATVNRRDWEALRACMTEDIKSLDRRPASPRGDRFTALAVCATGRAYTEAAPDVEMRSVQLIDAGNLGLANVMWSGHEADSGSAFAIPYLVVARSDGDRLDRLDFFNPEDERAALDRLLELQPDPAVRAAWKQQLDLVSAVNAHDAEALAHLFGPEVVVVDHRLGTTLSRAGLFDLLGRHHRLNLELLDTAGSTASMSRLHLIDADGKPAVILGQVTALRADAAARVELFEPDDEPGMRACFVGASAPRVGPVPPRSILSTSWQLHLDAYAQGATRRDWTSVEALLAPSFLAVDHRRLRVFDALSKAAFLRYAQGVIGFTRRYEVIAATEAACAGSLIVPGSMAGGGGSFEIALRAVFESREARCVRVQLFDADDEAGMLAALRRLQADGAAPPATSETPGDEQVHPGERGAGLAPR